MEDRWSQQWLWGHRAQSPILNQDEKYHFLFFCLFNKNILEEQHATNAEKSAEVDVLQLLKLQNVLPPKPWLWKS